MKSSDPYSLAVAAATDRVLREAYAAMDPRRRMEPGFVCAWCLEEQGRREPGNHGICEYHAEQVGRDWAEECAHGVPAILECRECEREADVCPAHGNDPCDICYPPDGGHPARGVR